MKEKCCRNCFFFREEVIKDHFTKIQYSCEYHKLYQGEVSHPDSQYCGDDWMPAKRIKNLEDLGI
jgi:hypothetical protein